MIAKMQARVPIMAKPSFILRTAEEKILTRILDKFDIRLFFKKSRHSDVIEFNLMLCVRMTLSRYG